MPAFLLMALQRAGYVHQQMHCASGTPKTPEEHPISKLGLFLISSQQQQIAKAAL